MKKLTAKEATYAPVCPHCEKDMKEVHWKKIESLNAEYAFLCPNCRKVLGFGVRNQAWGS